MRTKPKGHALLAHGAPHGAPTAATTENATMPSLKTLEVRLTHVIDHDLPANPSLAARAIATLWQHHPVIRPAVEHELRSHRIGHLFRRSPSGALLSAH